MRDYFAKDCNSLLEKRLWLLDMDGTVYIGDRLFSGIKELLQELKRRNKQIVFITNNSSRGKEDYVKKLRRLGVEVNKDDFYTSVDATVEVLKREQNGKTVYVQGTKSFIKELKNKGIKVVTKEREEIDCVVVGFDTELTHEKLLTTCKVLKKDLPYYATNPDWVCPTEFGYVPDCGSMCYGIEKATGRKPKFIGKPNPFIVLEAIKKFGATMEETVVVGDRIYTDIMAGINAKVQTLLVLSGESTVNDYERSEDKPDFVLENLAQVKEGFNE